MKNRLEAYVIERLKICKKKCEDATKKDNVTFCNIQNKPAWEVAQPEKAVCPLGSW